MTAERRIVERKLIQNLVATDLTVLDDYLLVANEAEIIDASKFGFKLAIHRSQLVPPNLKHNLDLSSLVAHDVALYLPQMHLDLDGKIVRSEHIGKGWFHVAIEFSDDVPDYWRECLMDLRPAPGELD